MDKTIRVGMMPGKIQEIAVRTGMKISECLQIAGLNPSGYTVKVDGVKCDDVTSAVVGNNTNLILLAKEVKGN